MKPLLQPSTTIGNATRPGDSAGLWRISDDGLLPVPGPGASGGPATVLVPGEDVLLLAVDLPLATRRQRIDALAFAVEDRIAEPVDRVHLALGEAIGPRRYLVGVVAHEAMARWVALADAAGLGHAALLPDPLTLAVPPEGEWGVTETDGRALVRCPDGTGFVVPADMLEEARVAAGAPALTAGRAEAGTPLDLRQGIYSPARAQGPWRRVAIVAAAGLAAHAAIAAADTMALRRVADRWRGETAADVALVAPGAAPGDDLAATAADLVPAETGGAPGRFLPLLDRASAVLAGSGVAVRGIGYRAGTLALAVEGDEAALSRATAALAAGGLTARRAPGLINVSGR